MTKKRQNKKKNSVNKSKNIVVKNVVSGINHSFGMITYEPSNVDVSLEVVRKAISFIVCDTIAVCRNHNITNSIAHIFDIRSENKDPIKDDISNISIKDDKYKLLKNLVADLKNDHIILTSAYVSRDEFPDDKYYLYNEPNTEGKKHITNEMIDKVLDHNCKKLEELGFININQYIGYEYQTAFIYGNEIGKKIAKYMMDMTEDPNEE